MDALDRDERSCGRVRLRGDGNPNDALEGRRGGGAEPVRKGRDASQGDDGCRGSLCGEADAWRTADVAVMEAGERVIAAAKYADAG